MHSMGSLAWTLVVCGIHVDRGRQLMPKWTPGVMASGRKSINPHVLSVTPTEERRRRQVGVARLRIRIARPRVVERSVIDWGAGRCGKSRTRKCLEAELQHSREPSWRCLLRLLFGFDVSMPLALPAWASAVVWPRPGWALASSPPTGGWRRAGGGERRDHDGDPRLPAGARGHTGSDTTPDATR